VAKEHNEFRDPIHVFIVLTSDERKVVNSRAFQRLRHIHQVALTWLIYPVIYNDTYVRQGGTWLIADRKLNFVTRKQEEVR
jgi:uncharacterized protein